MGRGPLLPNPDLARLGSPKEQRAAASPRVGANPAFQVALTEIRALSRAQPFMCVLTGSATTWGERVIFSLWRLDIQREEGRPVADFVPELKPSETTCPALFFFFDCIQFSL